MLKSRFVVYIIEWRDEHEVNNGCFEGDVLQKVLKFASIPTQYKRVVSADSFKKSLLLSALQQVESQHASWPVIHYSGHGSPQGIGPTAQDNITWATLRDVLTTVNQAINGALFMCMSTCSGLYARSIARTENDTLPFFALIGNEGPVLLHETIVSYLSFYTLLQKGLPLELAVQGMNTAAGLPGGHRYVNVFGLNEKTDYIEYLAGARAFFKLIGKSKN